MERCQLGSMTANSLASLDLCEDEEVLLLVEDLRRHQRMWPESQLGGLSCSDAKTQEKRRLVSYDVELCRES